MFIFATLLITLTQTLLYDPSQYQLGNNLIANSAFDNPFLATLSSVYYSLGMPGWNCTVDCQHVNVNRRCAEAPTPVTCNVSFVQAVDVDSDFVIDHYTQNIPITTAGQYLLTVKWMPSTYMPIGKDFGISVNNTQIANIVVTDSNYIDHIFEIIVNATVGNLLLDVHETNTINDTFGSYLGDIQLKQLILIEGSNAALVPLSSTLGSVRVIASPLLDNVTGSINKLPGNRIFAKTLSGFLLAFDRMQFYYFHQQNLTFYSEILLSNANKFALERGSLPQELIEGCSSHACKTIIGVYDGLLEQIEHKKNYTDARNLERNPKGLGFFANNLDFFFYELPMLFGIYLLLALAFRALFNFRISKYIRKYAFTGILLFIVYEGNVEQFAFFFFNECKTLFSVNLPHKLANVFMIYFFFLLIVFTIGGLLFFTFNYRKLVKYFMEDSKDVSFEAMLFESLELSIFPFVFGAVHALLLDNLYLQTIVLLIVEGLYLVVKLFTLRSLVTLFRFKAIMCAVTSLLRLCFIVSFYYYESSGHPTLVNSIHHDLVWMYVISWLV